jgi:hypothetical protein
MGAYVTDLLGEPYGAVVYADGAVHAEWWSRNGDELVRGVFRSVLVTGPHLKNLNAPPVDDERLRRQTDLVTHDGQATISSLRVAVAGNGGTGSHLAPALVYLGFRDVLLFDDDRVETVNLNRLPTAGLADVGAPKNLAARRRMREVDPAGEITCWPSLTPGGDHKELLDIDLLIGCVDDDGPRDRLNQIAVDHSIPYIDIATGVDTTAVPPAVGGRVLFVLPGGPCLHCWGELAADEIAKWVKSATEQELDRRHGYGTDKPDPAVVHLNGLAVYAALAELVTWVSGVRPPTQGLDIDLSGHLCRRDSHPGVRVQPRAPVDARDGCFACGRSRGPGRHDSRPPPR